MLLCNTIVYKPQGNDRHKHIMSIADEFPLVEANPNDHSRMPSSELPEAENTLFDDPAEEEKAQTVWGWIAEVGLLEPSVRLGTHILAIILVFAVIAGMRQFYFATQTVEIELPQRAVLAASSQTEATPPAEEENGPESLNLPAFQESDPFAGGIRRFALLQTAIPKRPRVDVEIYIVQPGDTVFGIAEKYNLRPETIFWGNRETLNDDPHNLYPGQELYILPVDGVYHKWSAGENFQKVAEFYGVDPQAIVEYPGNRLDVYAFDMDNPNLEPGQRLIIPGGKREFVNWGPPIITRSDPAVASTYGPGFCGQVYDGAVGSATFVWPTTATYLSGYDYSPASNHYGIDIAGDTGNPVFAVDAGVVVYAGWSNYGYGSLIVLDHGTGWQSLYAHLSGIYVSCGQSVFQGTSIGAVGNTGNSSGSHLHFELIYSGAKVNPWDFISP